MNESVDRMERMPVATSSPRADFFFAIRAISGRFGSMDFVKGILLSLLSASIVGILRRRGAKVIAVKFWAVRSNGIFLN